MPTIPGGTTIYQTANGPKSVDQMYSELVAAGWPGPAGGSGTLGAGSIANAYAQTAGGNVMPMGSTPTTTPSTPTAPGGGGTGANLNAAQLLLDNAQKAAYQAYLSARLNLDSDQEAYQKAAQVADTMMKQAQLTGVFNGQPTLAAQQQQFQQGLDLQSEQNKTALGFLQQVGSLRGPNDPFQYLKTLAGTPQGITDVVNAASGRYMMGGAPSGEQAAPASVAGQVGMLNAATAAGGGQGNVLAGGAAPTSAAPGGPTPLNLSTYVPGVNAAAANSPAAQAAANAGGYNWGKFGVNGPAPGATVGAIAPGSSGTSHAGTLIPGTTSMMAGGAQDLGYGPGQGGVQLSGTGGTNVTGYNPQTGELNFQYQFLTNKQRAVFGLYDNTTGQFVADPSNAQIGATPGNGGVAKAGDWMTYPYYSGASGTGTLKVGQAIDPSHSYSIRVAFPLEGGGAGPNIEQPFTGTQVLQVAQQPQTQAQQTPAATPAAPAAAPAADPYQTFLDTLPRLPAANQVAPQQYNKMDPSQQAALWAAYEAGIGPSGAMRPEDAQAAYARSLPKYVMAPGTTGTMKF
jgi:hypothetical protein